MEHSYFQSTVPLTDSEGRIFLKYSYFVSGIYGLEFSFAKLTDYCVILGYIRYLRPNDLYVQTFGTVTAHLPSVGFSKQVAIEDSLFHLRLESQGYYVLFFDLDEHKFSITLDLQDFSPPRLLTETEL